MLKLSIFVYFVWVLGASASAHEVGATKISPRVAVVGRSSTVTVSISIPDTSVIPTGINLLRVSSDGAATILGTLNDKGIEGDRIRGDGIYTGQVTFNETATGEIKLRISIPFKGSLTRRTVDLLPVLVQADNAADLARANLALALNAGNISTAISFFIDEDKASAILSKLPLSGRQKLVAAIVSASLVSTQTDMKTYKAPWVAPNGHDLQLEFVMQPDVNGAWKVASW